MRLSPEREKELRAIAHTSGLDLILAFGSTVTGKQHAHSDLDIAVRFRHGAPQLEPLVQVQAALSAVFGQEVDLAVLNHADPLFLHQIMSACELLHGDPRALLELQILAFRRVCDHQRYLAYERRYVNDFLERYATGA